MFAKRLKELRTERRLSQTDLATILNISNRTISMYETGNSEPSADILAKLSIYFGVTTDYLIGITNSRNPANTNISNVFNLSDEAIDILKNFPLTIAQNNGLSLSDILNALIINPRFTQLLKRILLYVSRNQSDWEDYSKYIAQHILDETNSNITEAKKVVQSSIVADFNFLLTELLNSEISSYNKIDVGLDGVHISAAHQNPTTE